MIWYIVWAIIVLLLFVAKKNDRKIRCFLLKQRRREHARRRAEQRSEMYRRFEGNEAAQKMLAEWVEGRGGGKITDSKKGGSLD